MSLRGGIQFIFGGEAVLMCPRRGGQVRAVETAEIKYYVVSIFVFK